MRGRELVGFAAGGLRGHGLRSALTLLGVAIGVAAVIALTSLGEGARLYVTGEFSSLGSNLVILVPGKTETTGQAPLVSAGTNDLTLDDAQAIGRQLRSVRRVAPVTVGTASVDYESRSRQSTVFGTTHSMKELRQLRIRAGRYLPAERTDGYECVLGAKIASELFGARNPLGAAVRVGGVRMRVIGVMEARGTSVGLNMDEVVHVPVETAMRMFDLHSLFRVLLEARSPADIPRVQDEAIALLEERHRAEDVTAITQDAILGTFSRVLSMLTVALGLIATISLAVAGIGIMNVMLVSVSERTKEIGLLKALGVTERQVLAVFLIEAACVSSVGGLFGLLLGLGAASALRAAVPGFPVQPPVWAVVLAILVSTAVGIVFGLLPARRAMRLDPVLALTGRER